ncbi:hypothetical protein DXB60_09510 [Bacteroides fragilis]|nr:hypothetical protein DXB60_09510 [Bacteroides fragilis]
MLSRIGSEGLVCINIVGTGGRTMVRGIILTFCMFRGDNARQRVTPLPRTWKGRKMCFTLPHIQKLKNDFSMELTIIETSAYQELRRLVSTLAVQMDDLQKKIAPPAPDK